MVSTSSDPLPAQSLGDLLPASGVVKEVMLGVRPYRLLRTLWSWGGSASCYTSGASSIDVEECKEPDGKGKEFSIAVSSLRADTVAAAGLDISRKHIWEAVMDELVMLNGKILKKKSTSVKEGDIVEVDTIVKQKRPSSKDNDKNSQAGNDEAGDGGKVTVKRGRVVVKEIGEPTRKGGHHITLIRYKQFALFQKKLYSTIVSPRGVPVSSDPY